MQPKTYYIYSLRKLSTTSACWPTTLATVSLLNESISLVQFVQFSEDPNLRGSAYPLLCDADDDNLYNLTYSSGLPIWEKRFTMSAVIRHKSHNHHLLIWMRGKAPGTAGSKDGERWVSGRGGAGKNHTASNLRRRLVIRAHFALKRERRIASTAGWRTTLSTTNGHEALLLLRYTLKYFGEREI